MTTFEDLEEYLKKEDAAKEYVSKNIFSKRLGEIETNLEKKITKEEIPDHSIYALKEEIATLRSELNSYIKKSELTQILKEQAGNIMSYIESHTNHRYVTHSLFNKIKHDLNVKLKKLDHRWRDI